MAPNKRVKYDWDAEVRRKENKHSKVGNKPAKFTAEPTTLAWLHTFASRRSKDKLDDSGLEDLFPWLWNPDWDGTVELDAFGVKQLKTAVRQAEAMEGSLSSFLHCVQDRLARVRRSLKEIAPKSYFPLLSDDVLAMIFEFAAMPFSWATGDEYDNKSPSRISQVSKRFRSVALGLPRIWRYIDVRSDTQLIASRSTVAGPILEVCVKSTKLDYKEKEERNEQLYSFMGRIATHTSRISFLRFDLSLNWEENFFKKLNDLKKFAKLSFPFLRELVLDYECSSRDYRSIHFYRRWDLPLLRVLKLRNVIPEFHSPMVLANIVECSFTIDRARNDSWKFPKVSKFLSSFSSAKTLDLVLHGQAMSRHFNCYDKISLPSIESLRTAFPDMLQGTVEGFVGSLRTPNKKRWTIELAIEEYYLSSLFDGVIASLFSFDQYTPISEQDVTHHANLKEVNIVLYCEFPHENCTSLSDVSQMVPNLERLTVTYNSVAEQLRRFELNNCKGRLASMVKNLEETFEESLTVENPYFVVD